MISFFSPVCLLILIQCQTLNIQNRGHWDKYYLSPEAGLSHLCQDISEAGDAVGEGGAFGLICRQAGFTCVSRITMNLESSSGCLPFPCAYVRSRMLEGFSQCPAWSSAGRQRAVHTSQWMWMFNVVPLPSATSRWLFLFVPCKVRAGCGE